MTKLGYISKRNLYQCILSLMILLMVYAAVSKGLAFNRFTGQLSKSPLFGGWYKQAGILILLVEVWAACLLFFPLTQRLGLWSCLMLLLVFTLYIIGMILFMPKLPCSCGGIIEKLGWKGHIVFNCCFIVLAGIGLFLQRTESVT